MHGKWIEDAIKNPGALRKAAGAKDGEKISESRLQELAKGRDSVGQRARLALTLRKITGGKSED